MPLLSAVDRPRSTALRVALVALLALGGCAENARLPIEAGIGPTPQLPPPQDSLIPTVHIAKAEGWPDGAKPVAAPGLAVQAFATGLQHPRWLHVLPNGDVLVAESDAPPKPDGNGIMEWVKGLVMNKAGSGRPSANRITLLRDADGDGTAEMRTVLLERLNSPFGMALVGQRLYVANTDAVVWFAYRPGQTRIDAPPTRLVALPAGPINQHWTKNLVASADGSKLYASVGSNSNIAENGMQAEAGRAAIWEIDLASGKAGEFATGLRNPNGMAFVPGTSTLWTVVNERDELGGDLVPDYLTSVRRGAFYGWPYSYFGRHVDERVQPQRPERVAEALVPDYALGSHVAPLGLCFSDGKSLTPAFAHGAFIGEHGSWNRKPRSGYKVVFVPFAGEHDRQRQPDLR
jgi:glucose/arabinose dehydrogenase